MSITPLRQQPSWKALEQHHAEIGTVHLRELFAQDLGRGERLCAEAAGLYLDYAKNRVTGETMHLLCELARACGVEERRDAMFRGEHINVSEDRPALHVALRMPRGSSLVVDGVDVVAQVHSVLDRMAAFAQRIRSGGWKGHTGKPIRNIVNVGIGGSDLGPVMAYEALRHHTQRDLTFRFVSNVDALARSPKLEEFTGRVSDSGEGRWTVLAAVDEGVPAAVITTALTERFQSRGLSEFADKLLSAMRSEFGGHTEKRSQS
ncbi:hypothetical protein [Saccharopolyspora pogona]|uniref:hypothetical protein n=1 Tax=Saccharopolyspora pogona TaxID=333966 RepID=UPI001CC2561C|nr:hypothetical protein [Saccharopolyspora pogona]